LRFCRRLGASRNPAGHDSCRIGVRGPGRFGPASVVVQGGRSWRGEWRRRRHHDLRGLTLLGLIDTSISTHFSKDGRATAGRNAQQSILHEAENAYVTLMAGFDRAVGSPLDVDVRAAIARNVIQDRVSSPHPSRRREHRHADQIRAFVRKVKAVGADS
jgi:hypothetical protein